jgi:hypothetical protein
MSLEDRAEQGVLPDSVIEAVDHFRDFFLGAKVEVWHVMIPVWPARTRPPQ